MLAFVKSVEGEKTMGKREIPSPPQVKIRGIPDAHNDWLTDYFSATFARTRLYWLLASLSRHQSIRTANAMAFDFFLAIIPTLGLAGWAAALLAGSGSKLAFRAIFVDLTPSQLSELIGHQFEALAASHLAPIAALAGLWLSSSAFNTMIGVFDETFECLPRHWLHSRAIALAFALLGLLLLALGSGLYAWLVLPAHVWGAGLREGRESALFGWIFILPGLLAVTGFLAVVYRYSIRRPGRKRHVWTGAVVATLIGAVGSVSLGYYATYIARYTLFYGSLAVIVVALLWLWLWSTAILIGAEINIALEDVKRASRDASAGGGGVACKADA